MESVFQVTNNGQSVIAADFNTLGQYGLMDDRVFAEFLRLAPFTGAVADKAIFPYGKSGVVIPNGASGSVLLNPFRAVVGSRTGAGTDALANWRDIRSTIWVGGATSLTAATGTGGIPAIAANVSGNPRWDLIYLVVTPDANSPTVPRKKKDPATGAITGITPVVTKVTTSSVQIVTGTPAASPAFPALPADGGGNYNIPLAYVRIPNAFGALSTVSPKDIVGAAPIAQIRAAGHPGLSPADNCNAVGGVGASGGLQAAVGQTWGSSGTRPPFFLPTDLTQGPSKIIAIDMPDGTPGHWSHPTGAILDDTVDWRNRYFQYQISVGSNKLASDQTIAGMPTPRGTAGNGALNASSATAVVSGMGQSFIVDGTTSPMPGGGPATGCIVAYVDNTGAPVFAAASAIAIYVDSATGKLMFWATGTTWPARLFVWIESTSQMSNV